jgi:hypothetical protein
MKTETRQRWQFIAALFRRAGPYVLIELLLPGGTLFALALFVYRRSRRDRLPFTATLHNEVTRTVDDLGRRLGADRGAWLPAAHPSRDGLEPLAMAPGC